MTKMDDFLEKHKTGRRAFSWAMQSAVFVVSGFAAFLLRFDFALPSGQLRYLKCALPVWLISKIATFWLMKLDRGLWKYASVVDIVRLAVGNVGGSLLSLAIIVIVAPAGFPRSVYALDLIVCFVGTCGLRLMTKLIQAVASSSQSERAEGKIALVYGAGDAGVTLLREIRNNPRLEYEVIGFLDDDACIVGCRVSGLWVLGTGNDISRLVKKYGVQLILIAIPSASGAEMTRILELCHAAGIECKTIPGLGDIIQGGALAGQIREVAVEDLLGRTPIHLHQQEIRGAIADKVVLITGAAGSIGSELCRQIARFRPASIVGFEIAESPLFEIDREMRQLFPSVPFFPEIGSVQNYARLHDVFRQYKPSVVYHAAAYKHVPLMEANVFEAIENNVFGTYHVAVVAKEHGADSLVMISSDKAVRPTNIMGATKRLAELLLLGLQNGGTEFIAVRFGNVLGSNGSVVPIFKKQIAAGGPVTVTHPEMRRFFMTIPEACQLVLQASAIGHGGQICVLDMGNPVKIVELAKNLILLSGLKPEVDIKIEFTGMRPGEKMYEELSSLLEDTVSTAHEKVRIFVGNVMPEEDVLTWLELLHGICDSRDTGRLVVALKEIVQDYSPSTDLLKRVIRIQNEPERVDREVYR